MGKYSAMMQKLRERILRRYRENGLSGVVRSAPRAVSDLVLNRWYKLTSAGSFTLGGREYPYFRHTYNLAHSNERTVEVPIIYSLVQAFAGRRILEIGNVLRHYYPALQHDVVDKYEAAPGVVNADIADFTPEGRYDLIVSISTFEHVGWDEDPRDPRKVERAVQRLREELLAPGGTCVATIPLGYNPNLEASLAAGTLGFDRYAYLRRLCARNRWAEVSREETVGVAYGQPYPYANALAIAVCGVEVLLAGADGRG